MAEQDGSEPKGFRRRLLVLRLAVIGGASTALSACVPAGQPQYGAPMRTGLSDSDPSDPPGRGRGGHRGSGVTDSDPSDQPGYGRGRGGYRSSGVSDSDPSDPPGRGRRGW